MTAKKPGAKPGRPKKYDGGTIKKTYCLPAKKFAEADRMILEILKKYMV